jgi:hypothetical protein
VTDDWVAALPREKGQVFDVVVQRWECAYAMMSVALDDALSLRTRGRLVCARQQVSTAAVLLNRLANSLSSTCRTIVSRGQHVSELPPVEPLKAQFFRGDTGQSAASWNVILHHVLFGGRSRFLHKLRILSETVEHLASEFRDVASDISEGLTTEPSASWNSLDSLHYDFNTCLCELEVVFKSFLRTLPQEQLQSFAAELDVLPPQKAPQLQPAFSRASTS